MYIAGASPKSSPSLPQSYQAPVPPWPPLAHRVRFKEGAMDGWPKPVACAALATVLASSGDHLAVQGKVPGLTEVDDGGCEILHHQKDGWTPINKVDIDGLSHYL